MNRDLLPPTGNVARPDARFDTVFSLPERGYEAWLEAPRLGPDGALYLAEVNATGTYPTMIWRFDVETSAAVPFIEPSGTTMGLGFDQQGRLLACEAAAGGGRCVSRWDMSTRERTVLVDSVDGKRLNSPNDLVIDRTGNIYFTDPRYFGDEERDLTTQPVLRRAVDGTVTVITTDIEKPNGIALSRDGRALYIGEYVTDAIPQAGRALQGRGGLYRIPLAPDGSAAGPVEKILDLDDEHSGINGIEFDSLERLFLAVMSPTAPGVLVFDPRTCEKLAFLPTGPADLDATDAPNYLPTNVTIGADGHVFVTRDRQLLRIRALATPRAEAPGTGFTLIEHQRLATSGARAIAPFRIDGALYLAVPQLAEDRASQRPNMNGGNSDVDVLVYRSHAGRFVEHQRLLGHGSEDTEFFVIGDRTFLAVANIRSGARPYDMHPNSVIYEWQGGRFEEFQSVATFAAKQWRYFRIEDRHFLAVANGVTGGEASGDPRSHIYEFDGEKFVDFQVIESSWSYQYVNFEMAGQHYMGICDNSQGSTLFRWNGERFESFQVIEENGGRDMQYFELDGQCYLAFANLMKDSCIYRFNGEQFESFQTLSGGGGHNFLLLPWRDQTLLVRINFVTGGRAAPQPALQSQVYRWNGEGFSLLYEFPTFGGTDLAAFERDGQRFLAVSNSLTPGLRFRQDSVIYRIPE